MAISNGILIQGHEGNSSVTDEGLVEDAWAEQKPHV
jgi:hypothetical protein